MPAEDLHGRTVGVDRLQSGDHAFFSYSDDETRWEILSVFTQQGFARDEKVGLLVDVGYSADWVAERVAGDAAAARRALRDGQLVVSNAPRFARGGFDAGRLVEGARRRLDTVLAEGYAGLRSASEMSLALAPIDHLGQAVEYEIALHASLFSGQQRSRYTALCYWDERLFGETDAMKEARSVHPVILLPRTGPLRATVSANRVSLTGESDLSSRDEFDAALRTLAELPATTCVLDIADLSFFDAHSAGAVLRLAAGLTAPRRLEVHCRGAQRRLLYLLGGRSITQLSVITMRL
jgi:MEDS: MEthanogen/methylotroph, DcmR Sensory domain